MDVRAEAAFDAPKRLVVLSFVALAATLAFAIAPPAESLARRPTRQGRAVLLLLFAALLLAAISSFLSPRRAASLDALRPLVVMGLLLPLGASRVLDGTRGRALLAVLLAGASLSGLVCALQAAGLYRPYQVESFTGRSVAGAFLGNDGHLAQLLVLALLATAVALLTSGPPARWALLVLSLPLLLGLLVTRNLTAFLVLLAGTGALLPLALRRPRAALSALAVAAVLLGGALAYQPLRFRFTEAWNNARAGDWDPLLSYRLGPWAAAAEMVRERPLVGFGPGTFGAEFVPHRLAAELRYRRRFLNPRLASSYGEAHSDALQVAAEAGVPAALALLAASALLVGRLLRVVRDEPGDREVVILLGTLLAGCVQALMWFPLQITALALPLLLAAGRAFRLALTEPEEAVRPASAPLGLRLLLPVSLAAALAPEPARYLAERRLYELTGTFRAALASPPPDVERTLDRIAGEAERLAGAWVQDSRALILAGSCHLLLKRGREALELYEAALARGERAEIDLGLGRALALAGRTVDAEMAIRRAAWVGPSIVRAAMPEAGHPVLDREDRRLTADLEGGRMPEPPRLPVEATKVQRAPVN